MTEEPKTLEELVAEHQEKVARKRELNKNIDGWKSPPTPTTLVTLEELQRYKDKLSLCASIEADLVAQRNLLNEAQRVLQTQIIDRIGIKGVWVKAGPYAVGFVWDTWGGGHYKLKVLPSDALLPPLIDQTYYP